MSLHLKRVLNSLEKCERKNPGCSIIALSITGDGKGYFHTDMFSTRADILELGVAADRILHEMSNSITEMIKRYPDEVSLKENLALVLQAKKNLHFDVTENGQ
jgi:hypothetical protein